MIGSKWSGMTSHAWSLNHTMSCLLRFEQWKETELYIYGVVVFLINFFFFFVTTAQFVRFRNWYSITHWASILPGNYFSGNSELPVVTNFLFMSCEVSSKTSHHNHVTSFGHFLITCFSWLLISFSSMLPDQDILCFDENASQLGCI